MGSQVHNCSQSVMCFLLPSRQNPSPVAKFVGDMSQTLPSESGHVPLETNLCSPAYANMLEHLREWDSVSFRSGRGCGGERGGVGASRWHLWVMFASSFIYYQHVRFMRLQQTLSCMESSAPAYRAQELDPVYVAIARPVRVYSLHNICACCHGFVSDTYIHTYIIIHTYTHAHIDIINAHTCVCTYPPMFLCLACAGRQNESDSE